MIYPRPEFSTFRKRNMRHPPRRQTKNPALACGEDRAPEKLSRLLAKGWATHHPKGQPASRTGHPSGKGVPPAPATRPDAPLPRLEIRLVAPLNALAPRASIMNPPTPLVPIPSAWSPPAMLYLSPIPAAQEKVFCFPCACGF
jgi:hypothetical protein